MKNGKKIQSQFGGHSKFKCWRKKYLNKKVTRNKKKKLPCDKTIFNRFFCTFFQADVLDRV